MSPLRHTAFPPRLLLTLWWAAFCGHFANGQRVGTAPDPPAAESAQAVSSANRPPRRLETWDVLKIEGRRVGYRHTSRHERTRDGAVEVTVRSVERLQVARAGQVVQVAIELESHERGGRVQTFRYVEQSGPPGEVRVVQQGGGRVNDGQITWFGDAAPNGTRPDQWPAGAGGYFGLEQSLREAPMEPGETRRTTNLVPLIDAFAETELTARDYVTVELLDRTARLLRIDCVAHLPGGVRLASTLWCDAQGEVLQSEVMAMKLVSVRTTRNRALAGDDTPADVMQSLLVKVDPPLKDVHQLDRVTLDVRMTSGNVGETFATDIRQQVEPLGTHRARVTMTATWGDFWARQEATDAPAEAPAPAYLASRGLVQHAAPEVRRLALSVAPDEQDPWQLALALERLVDETITEKNFESTMASASEVVQTRAGDCTEHAVLLAALCRARGIPSRVAVGLVYVPEARGFLYHMWTEVWVRRTWRPLDATLGRGGIGPVHLKIGDSALDESTAYASVLPVLNVVGQLEVRAGSEQ